MGIPSMPGVNRLSLKNGVNSFVAEARSLGVNQVVIFPKTPDALKTRTAEEAFNPNGLSQRTIRQLKDAFPDLEVYTDVALDPYNSDGHDGIVRDDGVILNDETIEYLCRQAISQAQAGADVVSPSDMMDGRVGAIRAALDDEGFTNVSIMAYTAKYASAFYGPFRDALDSAPRAGTRMVVCSSNGDLMCVVITTVLRVHGVCICLIYPCRTHAFTPPSSSPCSQLPFCPITTIGEAHRVIPRNKREYQMDPANYREALRECQADEAEGADIMMVKPGLPYLDVIRLLRDNSTVPIAAYHVSGEYAMLKAAAQQGWLDEKEAVLETLISFRRAGTDLILTYYGIEAARWMNE